MQHIYKRRAVCSVLHGQLVCVRRVVHVVGHIGLNVGENVLVVVHCSVAFLSHKYVREFLVQDVLYLHHPSVTVDCRQL